MLSDNNHSRVAKGIRQCAAIPEGPTERRAMWLASGSPITRSVIQLLVWEWASLWLMFLMLGGTLMYNGFFTNERTIDSYPRLAVTLIYAVAYLVHFLYIWYICLSFLSKAAAGASWSLLERANFAVIDSRKLDQSSDTTIELKGIDKASAEYVPINIRAVLHHRKHELGLGDDSIPKLHSKEGRDEDKQEEEDFKEVSMALRTISAAQENERATTKDSASNAHDRIVSNGLLLMGITVASAFSSWTSVQTTENTPNNFNTSAIGSMALLTSLSLGVAALLSSALHLSIMDSSFWTILSLKEIKINGQALDHYKKRRRRQKDQANSLSFAEGTIPISRIRFFDIVTSHGVKNLFELLLFGPAYILLPRKEDHGRTSAETGIDFRVQVRDMTALLTTRATNAHMKTKYGENVEAINVCYIDTEKKVRIVIHSRSLFSVADVTMDLIMIVIDSDFGQRLIREPYKQGYIINECYQVV
ncbi:uncharacterized protein N7511_001455 [Penicillium nucicola]|uniref:uncharacterized protein n=1 Tax=Penicillium nucicola TaxID=1850975 RepID=UPI0025454C56|nr:uncharacterized protein N7511_001455 [Penicillium nucicola]KAJ5776444.1 hypothetical protein N7511_001455 [Penicillium nucicola]